MTDTDDAITEDSSTDRIIVAIFIFIGNSVR